MVRRLLGHLGLAWSSVIEHNLFFRVAVGCRTLLLLLRGVGCGTIHWNDAILVWVPDSVGRHRCRALLGLLRLRCWIAQIKISPLLA